MAQVISHAVLAIALPETHSSRNELPQQPIPAELRFKDSSIGPVD